MNKLFYQFIAIPTTIFFLSQNCHGATLSNGYFLEYGNKNETLSYDIEVEVLKEPISYSYSLGENNINLLEFLKIHGYEGKIYNYLGLNEGDLIKYPFRIKQTYSIKNLEDTTINIPISYFPLRNTYNWNSYSFLEETTTLATYGEEYTLNGSNIIQIGESYGVKNTILTQDGVYIPSYKKYVFDITIFDTLRQSSSNNYKIHQQKTIQLESNWDIQIKAGETSTIVFSYYATDLPTKEEKIVENNYYARYNFGNLGIPEPLFVPYTHSLTLPEGYSATSSHNQQDTIYGPYNGEVLMNQFGDLEIWKEHEDTIMP